jgi:hypothetical protein
MDPRVKRRMAMSRRLLDRPLAVVPPTPPRGPLTRPLTPAEQAELLRHDVRHLTGERSLLERALEDIDRRIRRAQQDVTVKRQDLQESWQTLTALETERRQILDAQAVEAKTRR